MALYTDINTNKGMPYGGMPADTLLEKLEVTDPALIRGGHPREYGNGLTGIEHKDYMVGELLDRSPDPGYLESDQIRRNPQMSREVLNLHYGGTRGSNGDLPRHPELFLGFTGNDPRGSENVPRFDEMRRQMEHRARQLEVQMGRNVGHDSMSAAGAERYGLSHGAEAAHQEAERPWTGPSLQKARVGMHEQVRHRIKYFDTSKDGRSVGRNVVTDQDTAEARRGIMANADEQWVEGMHPGVPGHQRSDNRGGAPNRLGRTHGSDSRNPRRGEKLWRNTETTADLHVAKYGQIRGAETRVPGKDARTLGRDGAGQQQELDGADRFIPTQNVAQRQGNRRSNIVIARSMAEGSRSRRARDERDPAGAEMVQAGASDKSGVARGAGTHMTQVDVAKAWIASNPSQAYADSKNAADVGSGHSQAVGVKGQVSGATQQAVWWGRNGHHLSALASNMARASGKNASVDVDTVAATYKSMPAGVRGSGLSQSGGENANRMGARPGENMSAGGGNSDAVAATAKDVSEQMRAARPAAAQELKSANYRRSEIVLAPDLGIQSARSTMTLQRAAAQGMLGVTSTQKSPEFRGQTQVGGLSLNEQEMGLIVGEGTADEGGRQPTNRVRAKTIRYDTVAALTGEKLDEDVL